MDDLKSVIAKSKKKIANQYFKIKNANGIYSIEQYFGLIMPTMKMAASGWYRHPYLEKYIDETYPIFNLDDFASTNGVEIIKKDQKEKAKDELLEYSNYFSMNNKLAISIKNLKLFLNALKIDFRKFQSFSEMITAINTFLNSLGISQLDKSNYILKFTILINDFFLQIESLKIENPRTFIDEKFKFLFLLINEAN